MPSVLTKDGWVVFDTQKEANEFRAKIEAMEGTDIPQKEAEDESPEAMEGTDIPQKEAEDESPTEFMKSLFMKPLKKKIGRRN